MIAAFLFAESRDYPDKAAMFPEIMLVCIMVLSAYTMGKSWLKHRRDAQATPAPKHATPKAPVDLKAVFAFGGMTVIYALLTPYAGFGLASLVFLGAGTVFFGERGKLGILGVPVAAMAFIYAFFIYFLDVGIPFFPALP